MVERVSPAAVPAATEAFFPLVSPPDAQQGTGRHLAARPRCRPCTVRVSCTHYTSHSVFFKRLDGWAAPSRPACATVRSGETSVRHGLGRALPLMCQEGGGGRQAPASTGSSMRRTHPRCSTPRGRTACNAPGTCGLCQQITIRQARRPPAPEDTSKDGTVCACVRARCAVGLGRKERMHKHAMVSAYGEGPSSWVHRAMVCAVRKCCVDQQKAQESTEEGQEG